MWHHRCSRAFNIAAPSLQILPLCKHTHAHTTRHPAFPILPLPRFKTFSFFQYIFRYRKHSFFFYFKKNRCVCVHTHTYTYNMYIYIERDNQSRWTVGSELAHSSFCSLHIKLALLSKYIDFFSDKMVCFTSVSLCLSDNIKMKVIARCFQHFGDRASGDFHIVYREENVASQDAAATTSSSTVWVVWGELHFPFCNLSRNLQNHWNCMRQQFGHLSDGGGA